MGFGSMNPRVRLKAMREDASLNFSSAPLDDGLSFEDQLPLAIVPCEVLPTMSERVRLNDRNVSLLKTHALEDFQRREIDADLEGLASEIERLDQKITLVTELLCDLLVAEAKIPAPIPMTLSVAGLRCPLPEGAGLQTGDWAIAELYLITTIPRPLKILTKVVHADADSVTLSFADLSDGVQSMLGRLVFRHHRREIALRRAGQEKLTSDQ